MERSTTPSAAAITADESNLELVLDISIVAPMLGLSPEAFMSGVQQGTIVQRTECGVDEDAA